MHEIQLACRYLQRMKRIFTATCIGFLVVTAIGAEDERLYVNNKKVPENRQDLDAIQSTLMKVLPRARAATVCVKLGKGSGSAVIVSPDGLVLTAAHVSQDAGKKVTLVFEDGTEVEGKTLGLNSETDAGMIQIVTKREEEWPYVEIDRDDASILGDWVFALGHSGGFDKDRGVVVRLGRLVRLANSTFQSDCLLIGGDSGGPLFDMNGKLIGINSRVGKELQSNMHVPMTEFTKYWDEMVKGEFMGEGPFAQKAVKGNGYLGMASEAHEGGGIKVTVVGENSPAEKSGIKVGDVLLTMNEKPLSKRDDLKEIMKDLSVGDEVVFELTRDGKKETLTVTIGER